MPHIVRANGSKFNIQNKLLNRANISFAIDRRDRKYGNFLARK